MFTHKWLEQQRMETTEGDFNSHICYTTTTYQPLVQLEKIIITKMIFLELCSQPLATTLQIVN